MIPYEAIAKVCHAVNKAYCEGVGDMSQVDWENAPEWQHISAIEGVRFAIHNPESGPEAQHETWKIHKVNDGWVYGPTKDAEKKTHPCLIPYRELPIEQQLKDKLFQAVVRAMAPYE